jgi:hypothetical protein
MDLQNDEILAEISDWFSHELIDEQVADVLRWLVEDSYLTVEVRNSNGEVI